MTGELSSLFTNHHENDRFVRQAPPDLRLSLKRYAYLHNNTYIIYVLDDVYTDAVFTANRDH